MSQSHNHTSVNVDSAVYSHTHNCYLEEWDAHDHTVPAFAGGSHQHVGVTVIFGNAGLGSPNWWEHKHPITIGCPAGGASHSHGLGLYSTYTVCVGVSTTHRHSRGTGAIDPAGASHIHGTVDPYTADADPAGTPENHTHTFSFWTDSADSHYHPQVGVTGNSYCAGTSNLHSHAYMATGSVDLHSHQLSGTSGSGGEAAGIASKRLLVGVGL